MISKPRNKSLVEFLVTSSRLADAFRHASHQNNVLRRLSEMHELGTARSKHRRTQPEEHAGEIVVLSHAEDERFIASDSLPEGMLAGAFHLLFTEPTTHPDQIAHWARQSNIRSEHRLHVVKVEGLETPEVSQLLGRVCFSLSGDSKRGSIIDAYTVGDSLLVRGPKHRLLRVHMDALTSLRNKPRAVRQKFEIDPDGSFLFWPDLDVHLGWNQFLQATDPTEFRKSQQKSEQFNRLYGAAIKKLRETAGISQSKIQGLTDRQVRRIEQGESRATAKSLTCFAKAHGLEMNAYLDALAKVMG